MDAEVDDTGVGGCICDGVLDNEDEDEEYEAAARAGVGTGLGTDVEEASAPAPLDPPWAANSAATFEFMVWIADVSVDDGADVMIATGANLLTRAGFGAARLLRLLLSPDAAHPSELELELTKTGADDDGINVDAEGCVNTLTTAALGRWLLLLPPDDMTALPALSWALLRPVWLLLRLRLRLP